jgi:hypothetical protein
MRSILRTQKNVVEEIAAKALAPTGIFRSPNRQNRAVSSYRLLGDVNTLFN